LPHIAGVQQLMFNKRDFVFSSEESFVCLQLYIKRNFDVTDMCVLLNAVPTVLVTEQHIRRINQYYHD
jgi:hypothetical protein